MTSNGLLFVSQNDFFFQSNPSVRHFSTATVIGKQNVLIGKQINQF